MLAAVAAAVLSAGTPSVVAVTVQNFEIAVTVVLRALEVLTEEMVVAAIDEGYDEASAVFLVNRDPGSGGKCLLVHPQVHLEQTVPTISCTLVLMSIPVFQICINGLPST